MFVLVYVFVSVCVLACVFVLVRMALAGNSGRINIESLGRVADVR